MAVHGHPRYTKDLDLWIKPEPLNAQRLVAALDQFGFGSLDLKPLDFHKPNRIVQLGKPPNRIDLLTTVPGVDFDDCHAQRVVVTLGGIDMNFIDLESLRKSERASGRLQDLADLENLE